jgi:hypothetical protein
MENLIRESIKNIFDQVDVDLVCFTKLQKHIIKTAGIKILESIVNDVIYNYIDTVFSQLIKDELVFSVLEKAYNNIYQNIQKLESRMRFYEILKDNALSENAESVRNLFHSNIKTNLFFRKYNNKNLIEHYINNQNIDKIVMISNYYKEQIILAGDDVQTIESFNKKIETAIANKNYDVAKAFIYVSGFLDNVEIFDRIYLKNLKNRMALPTFDFENELILKNYMLSRSNTNITMGQIENVFKDYEESMNLSNLFENSLEIDGPYNKEIKANFKIIRNIGKCQKNSFENSCSEVNVVHKIYENLFCKCVSRNFKTIKYDNNLSIANFMIHFDNRSINVIANMYQLSVLNLLTSSQFLSFDQIMEKQNIDEGVYNSVLDELVKSNLVRKCAELPIYYINKEFDQEFINLSSAENKSVTTSSTFDEQNSGDESENSDEDFF